MEYNKRIHQLKELVRSSPYRSCIQGEVIKSSTAHPSCGDEVIFSIRLESDRCVAVSVSGAGCLLSQAAAILAAEFIGGKQLVDGCLLTEEQLVEMLNIGPIGPTRRQCITIVVNAIKQLQTKCLKAIEDNKRGS